MRRHAIAGMVFSLLVGALIAARDAGLVHWNTPGAHSISVVKRQIIATVREWQGGGKTRRYPDSLR
jgi:hypothetical protein